MNIVTVGIFWLACLVVLVHHIRELKHYLKIEPWPRLVIDMMTIVVLIMFLLQLSQSGWILGQHFWVTL